MNGIEFLKAKNQDHALQSIPVVITTAEDSPSLQQTLLNMNVNDYVIKPYVRETMVRRVDNVLGSDKYFREVINRHSNSPWVINDYTTGIYTRSTAEKLINKMMKENVGMCAFLTITVDRFKEITKENGVQMTDRMIFELAQMLISMFRTNDVVARVNDDEICVLMSNIAGEETVESKCAQITEKVSNLDLKLTVAYLSCTIGAVVLENNMRFDEMLDLSHAELEKAKKDGASWSVKLLENK